MKCSINRDTAGLLEIACGIFSTLSLCGTAKDDRTKGFTIHEGGGKYILKQWHGMTDGGWCIIPQVEPFPEFKDFVTAFRYLQNLK